MSVNRTVVAAEELAATQKSVYGDHLQDDKQAIVIIESNGSNLAPLPPPNGVGRAGTVFVRIAGQAEKAAAVYQPEHLAWLANGLPVRVKFIDGWYHITQIDAVATHEAVGSEPLQPTFTFNQHDHTTTATGGALGADTVTATQIAANAVGATELADGAVSTAAKIANAIITGAKLVNATITTVQIAASTILGSNLANATVTQTKMANGSVGTAQIIDANVTLAKLAANSVDSAKLVDGAVTTSKLGAASVTPPKVSGLGSVTGYLYQNGVTSFGSRKYNVAVTDPVASNDSTQGYEIQSIWVNTDNDTIWDCLDATASAAVWKNRFSASTLAPDSVTTLELAVDAVEFENIKDGSIGSSKMGLDAWAYPGWIGFGTPDRINTSILNVYEYLLLPDDTDVDGHIAFYDNALRYAGRLMVNTPVARISTSQLTTAITNTTTETAIHTNTITMPANTWNVDTIITCDYAGRLTNTTGANAQLNMRIRVGGTEVLLSGNIVPTATSAGYIAKSVLTCRAVGVSGLLNGHLQMGYSGTQQSAVIPTAVTIDTTADRTVQFSLQWTTASAALAIDLRSLRITISN